jgi:anti-sigma factor RsiW
MSDKSADADGIGDADDLDALLGAYALDALEPAEARRVEEYLRVNPKAAAEVQDHREVATMLAFTGMDAPVGLWERIEAQLDDAPPQPGPELARVMAIGDAPTDRGKRRRFASFGPWLAAAAAVIVIAGVALVFVDRAAAPSTPIADAYEQARQDRDSAITELVAEGAAVTASGVIDQDGHGFLDARDLPALSPDQTYQLWGVMAESGDVISLGILGPNPELETFSAEGGVEALAVTIEASPGVVSNGNPAGAFVGTF